MRRSTTFAVVPVCTISLSACHSNCIVDNPIFDYCGAVFVPVSFYLPP